jgi:peptide deformylase
MIKRILTYPSDKEILMSKSEEVTDVNEVKDLIQDLKDTLKNTSGVGISAVQIGVLKKVCIIKYNGEYITMINPVITRTRDKVLFQEGCLSAPAVYTTVERAKKVWVEYLDETGKKRELDQGGLCSVIIQHELDHFEGGCEVFKEIKEDI